MNVTVQEQIAVVKRIKDDHFKAHRCMAGAIAELKRRGWHREGGRSLDKNSQLNLKSVLLFAAGRCGTNRRHGGNSCPFHQRSCCQTITRSEQKLC